MLHFADSLSLWARVAALIIAVIVGIAALIAFFSPIKLKVSRRTRTLGYGASMIAIVIAASGVVAMISLPNTPDHAKPINNGIKPINSRVDAKNPTVTIQLPGPQILGNPLPTVHCIQALGGIANLPPNDTLLIGNVKVGTGDYFLVPVTWSQEQPGHWTAIVYFGQRADGGADFSVTTVVIPQTLEAYIHDVYHFQRNEKAYLAGPGLPPAPAYVAEPKTVVRSPSKRVALARNS